MRLSHNSFWAYLSLVLLASHTVRAQDTTSACDACFYDSSDISGCKDYGTINGEIVSWPVATTACTTATKTTISSIDPSTFCNSANSFVNELKSGSLSSSDAKLGLGTSLGGFFEQSSNVLKIKASIKIGNTTYDCATSESDCYNAMKAYFTDDKNGKKEMKQVCQTLFKKVRADRKMEQSTVRIHLCVNWFYDKNKVPDACSTLDSEVVAKITQDSFTSCAAVGVGTGNSVIPGCEDRLMDGTPNPMEDGASEKTPNPLEDGASEKTPNPLEDGANAQTPSPVEDQDKEDEDKDKPEDGQDKPEGDTPVDDTAPGQTPGTGNATGTGKKDDSSGHLSFGTKTVASIVVLGSVIAALF